MELLMTFIWNMTVRRPLFPYIFFLSPVISPSFPLPLLWVYHYHSVIPCDILFYPTSISTMLPCRTHSQLLPQYQLRVSSYISSLYYYLFIPFYYSLSYNRFDLWISVVTPIPTEIYLTILPFVPLVNCARRSRASLRGKRMAADDKT